MLDVFNDLQLRRETWQSSKIKLSWVMYYIISCPNLVVLALLDSEIWVCILPDVVKTNRSMEGHLIKPVMTVTCISIYYKVKIPFYPLWVAGTHSIPPTIKRISFITLQQLVSCRVWWWWCHSDKLTACCSRRSAKSDYPMIRFTFRRITVTNCDKGGEVQYGW